MTPPLADPPASLGVAYDHHGIRCDLRPRAPRSRWLQVGLSLFSVGFTTLALVALVAGGVASIVVGGVLAYLLTALAAVVLAVLLGVAVIDSAEQLDHFQMRLGEGWLVLRFADQGSEIRLDLTTVSSTRVDLPDILLRDRSGDEAVIPMGGHDRAEILWLASAIDLAVRDARGSDVPAPAELLALLSTDGRPPI
jgi:uncharacterized membrane protein YuzA (DUF378 family)